MNILDQMEKQSVEKANNIETKHGYHVCGSLQGFELQCLFFLE